MQSSSPSLTRRRLCTGALATAVLANAPGARAAEWPTGNVRMVVPYPPGGFTDVTARLIAQKLQERLGQPFVIDNRAGANGSLGTSAVAKSAPDGSTFGFVIAAYAANTSLYAKLPYDPRRDLVPVSLLAVSPLVAAASPNAPFKTAAELVAYAKSHPGKISFGSSGTGSAAHLTTELLKAQNRLHMVHIPYRGAAPALADLMGGQIQLLFDAASGLINPGKSGKVPLIGVASEKRLAALPDVPTFIEQGVRGFTGSTWLGLLAPAGTPAQVVKRLSDECAAICRLDDVRARLEGMGTVPVGSAPQEFATMLEQETAKWGEVIRTARVTVE